MHTGSIFFIGVGVVIAVVGACVFLFNRGPESDEKMRQTGLVIFAAGLVVAVLTAVTARMPPHLH